MRLERHRNAVDRRGPRTVRRSFRNTGSIPAGTGAGTYGRIDPPEPIRAALTERIEKARAGLPRPAVRVGTLDQGVRRKWSALVIPAPEIMSLEENRAGLLGLIYEFQYRAFAQTRAERRATKSWVIDLSPVRKLTVGAALVLTAEYHRRVILNPGYRPVIDDQGWPDEVRSLMAQLGLYHLVKAMGQTGGEAPTGATRLRFVPFHTGTRVEQREARQLIDALQDVAGREPEREYIFAALVEAIKNVKHHAYTDEVEGVRLPSVGRWWAAGSYDPDEEVLNFVVYDQGVGIPATLPRRTFFQSILNLCPLEADDADLIAGGVQYGRTRLAGSAEADGRGNGLWSICNFMAELSGSSVRISSGRGEVVYSGGKEVERTPHANPLCGTVIQWTLKLPPLRAPMEATA